MKFYNREKELVQLHRLSELAYQGRATMTLLVGRRRVGKTELIKQCYQNDPSFLYFFISRKAEILLCEEFIESIAGKLSIPSWGEINKFLGFFEFILQQSTETPLTVVFDEFQDIKLIDETIFSGMQNLWDKYKNKSKIHLIVCGSIYSIMCKIFENSKEPLFGRADTKIHLKPLKINVIQQILKDHNKYSPINLLDVYTIVGGIPRYLDLLQMHDAWNLDDILKCILQENSFFVNEGKDILIEELGKEYKTYFSILSLIAKGYTSRSSIESVLQKTIGGHLENLEEQYSIIKRIRPIFATENSRNLKYCIQDNFLNFWFRYVNNHQTAVEIGNYQYLIDLIKNEFSAYSGKYLEKMIKELLAATEDYNNIGCYWEKDNRNEIDIVACNDRKKVILIADVKLQATKINLQLLINKAKKLEDKLSTYNFQYKGYSLENLSELL